jgi:hypothetical protein
LLRFHHSGLDLTLPTPSAHPQYRQSPNGATWWQPTFIASDFILSADLSKFALQRDFLEHWESKWASATATMAPPDVPMAELRHWTSWTLLQCMSLKRPLADVQKPAISVCF